MPMLGWKNRKIAFGLWKLTLGPMKRRMARRMDSTTATVEIAT